MSSRTLYRLSGGTLIVGSLLLSIGTVLTSTLYGNATPQQILSLPWLLVGLMIFIGSLLFVIGLPGMYLRQAGRAGVLGLIGFILLFFVMLLAGVVFIGVQVIVFPSLVAQLPGILGTILEVVSAIALAVACVWCGSRLLARQDETVEAVARPTAEVGVSR